MPHCYAQTNLQLYNQVLAANYAGQDLERVATAYNHALRLFSGVYRGNGKPFINHLVGTASILVANSAPPSTVLAGLLHAAYSHGAVSIPLVNLRWPTRRKLGAVLGEEAEQLVWSYTRFRLRPQDLPDLQRRIGEISELERNVITIRLANDLEDHLDDGLDYCAKEKSLYDSGENLECIRAIATSIGQVALADEIARLATARDARLIPGQLTSLHSSSFCLPTRPALLLRSAAKSLVATFRG